MTADARYATRCGHHDLVKASVNHSRGTAEAQTAIVRTRRHTTASGCRDLARAKPHNRRVAVASGGCRCTTAGSHILATCCSRGTNMVTAGCIPNMMMAGGCGQATAETRDANACRCHLMASVACSLATARSMPAHPAGRCVPAEPLARRLEARCRGRCAAAEPLARHIAAHCQWRCRCSVVRPPWGMGTPKASLAGL